MALQIAIFLISAAALSYEILLMRLLSIIQWQHFAAMIISVALLGFGASGTFVTLLRPRLEERFTAVFTSSAALFGLTSIGSFVVGQRLPFNPLELPWNWRQITVLGALYLVFAVPFFFAATCIVLAFGRAGGRISALYRADLAGAGTGALGVLLLLSGLTPSAVLKVVASAAFVAAAVTVVRTSRWAAVALLCVGVGFNFIPASWPRLQISQFKPLAQVLRVPGAVLAEERSSPLGFLSVVESREVPLRFAPGLSLNFVGELPLQVGLFVDAAAASVINRYDPARLDYLDFLVSSLPYYVRRPARVLVLSAGGGTEVLNALRRGVERVDALELHPEIVDLVSTRYSRYSGDLYRRSNVTIHPRQPREFLAATGETYDAVIDSSGAAAGMPTLAENYVYTVEGFEHVLRQLNAHGTVTVTRQVNMPPRDVLKLFGTAVAALERIGVDEPAAHVVLIRGWNAATLLVSRSRFTPAEIDAARRFCEERSLDVAFYAGMPRSEANRFNVLDEPYFYDGARALSSPGRGAFVRNYKFNITPATDDRPYLGHFFRWKSLPELLRLRTRGGAPLLELGYLVLIATLVQAAVAAIVLIVLPLAARSRTQLRQPGAGAVAVCFAALGLAFLFVEIVFIQKLTLLFGHPLAAVATALGAFLVFAGIGSGLSAKLRSPSLPITIISVLLIVYAVSWAALARLALPLPQTWKVFGAVLLLAPLAIAMGMPFPLAMRAAGSRSLEFVPWAWSINGCASVISPVAATVLAVHAGFIAVAVSAVVLYAVAAFAFKRLTS